MHGMFILNPAGAIVVENDGQSIATPAGWNDGLWHHFAIVVERTKAVSIYIDGELVTTGNSNLFGRYVGPRLSIGARTWREANMDKTDRFFDGFIDDVRIWNTARQPDQIKRDRLYQLVGDELGLQAYFPFDGIYEDVGVTLRQPVLTDESMNDHHLAAYLSAGTHTVSDTNYISTFYTVTDTVEIMGNTVFPPFYIVSDTLMVVDTNYISPFYEVTESLTIMDTTFIPPFYIVSDTIVIVDSTYHPPYELSNTLEIIDTEFAPSFALDAPPIQLPRLIEKVNYTYSLNNDEIYIALNEPAARIENTVLDITVRGYP